MGLISRHGKCKKICNHNTISPPRSSLALTLTRARPLFFLRDPNQQPSQTDKHHTQYKNQLLYTRPGNKSPLATPSQRRIQVVRLTVQQYRDSLFPSIKSILEGGEIKKFGGLKSRPDLRGERERARRKFFQVPDGLSARMAVEPNAARIDMRDGKGGSPGLFGRCMCMSNRFGRESKAQ